jgi:hypothetical protein
VLGGGWPDVKNPYEKTAYAVDEEGSMPNLTAAS